MAAIKGVRSPVHAEPHPSASDSTARPNGYKRHVTLIDAGGRATTQHSADGDANRGDGEGAKPAGGSVVDGPCSLSLRTTSDG